MEKNKLTNFNTLPEDQAITQLLSLCGSTRWAKQMAQLRPFTTPESLDQAADHIWSTMQEPDWLEAIATHPRIGDKTPTHATPQSQHWSQQEQSQTQQAASTTLDQLAAANQAYEDKFGITCIICATGKSAEEMLANLQRRLASTRESELREAAEQQRLITQIRLRKWLQPQP